MKKTLGILEPITQNMRLFISKRRQSILSETGSLNPLDLDNFFIDGPDNVLPQDVFNILNEQIVSALKSNKLITASSSPFFNQSRLSEKGSNPYREHLVSYLNAHPEHATYLLNTILKPADYHYVQGSYRNLSNAEKRICIQELIAQGANLECTGLVTLAADDYESDTSLQLCLDHDLDINHGRDSNQLPEALISSLQNGCENDILRGFLPNESCLVKKKTLLLLDNGADLLHEETMFTYKAVHDYTLLMLFAEKGFDAGIIRLLPNEISVNRANQHGNTALMLTVASTVNKNLIRLLLDHGAWVDQANHEGDTALMQTRFPQAMPLLIDHGANVNAANLSGKTPLMKACEFSRIDTVKLLLAAGADVNQPDHNGKSALRLVQDALSPEESPAVNLPGSPSPIFFALPTARRACDDDPMREILGLLQEQEALINNTSQLSHLGLGL